MHSPKASGPELYKKQLNVSLEQANEAWPAELEEDWIVPFLIRPSSLTHSGYGAPVVQRKCETEGDGSVLHCFNQNV